MNGDAYILTGGLILQLLLESDILFIEAVMQHSECDQNGEKA